MEKIINKLTELGINIGMNLLYAIIILLVGIKLISWTIKLLKKSRLNKRLDKGVMSFTLSFIKIVLYVVLFMTVAATLGVPLTSFVTILGSAGIAIGLALQGGLSNIAGGLIILFFKPFAVGDFIDTHTDSGTVKSINIFYTMLITPDNRSISIPNGNLANQSIVNYSKEKSRRLDINIGVSYKNNQDDVKKVLHELLKKDKRIVKEEGKMPFVEITDYLDSSVTYTIRVWVLTADYWDTKFAILSEIKRKFEENNISIPYPQLDVHIEK